MATYYKSDASNDEFIIEKIHYITKYKHDEVEEYVERDELTIGLVSIDNLIENLSLMNSVIDECAKQNEHYILYEHNKKNTYPPFRVERVNYNNKNYTRFTLNQFKRFYVDNIQNIITSDNVYIDAPNEEEGWTLVCDKNKLRKQKVNDLLNEIHKIKHQ